MRQHRYRITCTCSLRRIAAADRRAIVMHFRMAAPWFGILVLAAIVGPAHAQPAASTDHGTCVLPTQGLQTEVLAKTLSYEPCAPFTTVAPTTIDRISRVLFGEYNQPIGLALLSDGSVLIGAKSGLFHAMAGRIEVVTPPSGANCYPDMKSLIGAFNREAFIADGEVMGVRLDGSIAFRWSWRIQNKDASPTAFIGADRHGTLWFEWETNDRTAVYAYDPRTRVITPFNLTFVVAAFHSPNGHVYAATNKGLFELTSEPRVSVRLVHAPIPAPLPAPNQFAVDWPYGSTLSIRGVGADGSLWASTISQVIHVHPDGTTHVIRLAPPAAGWHMPPSPISLAMAPDGSIWLPWGPIHITTDDRVQPVTLPQNEKWSYNLSPSPDGTVWVLAYNEGINRSDVVHFALGDAGGTTDTTSKTSWIMTPSATSSPCR